MRLWCDIRMASSPFVLYVAAKFQTVNVYIRNRQVQQHWTQVLALQMRRRLWSVDSRTIEWKRPSLLAIFVFMLSRSRKKKHHHIDLFFACVSIEILKMCKLNECRALTSIWHFVLQPFSLSLSPFFTPNDNYNNFK